MTWLVGMHPVCVHTPLPHSLAGNFYVSLGINFEASQKSCTLQLVILFLLMLLHSIQTMPNLAWYPGPFLPVIKCAGRADLRGSEECATLGN